jgi:hypothetical protein
MTDWRTNRLLPALKQRGRGRGPGAIWYWSEPDILERAKIVYDALSRNRRSYYALWVLWFCGFEVSPADIRRIWLDVSQSDLANRRAEPGELLADKYVDEIETLTRQIKRGQGLEDFDARAIATEIVVAMHERPDIGFNDDEFVELLGALNRIVEQRKILGDSGLYISGTVLTEILSFERRFISLKAIRDLLTSSSDDEFLRAQHYLSLLGSLISAMIVAAGPTRERDEQLFILRTHVAPSFGPWIFRLALMVIKSGQERHLEASEQIIGKIRGRLLAGTANGGNDRRTQALTRQLDNIWRELDVKRLYNLP